MPAKKKSAKRKTAKRKTAKRKTAKKAAPASEEILPVVLYVGGTDVGRFATREDAICAAMDAGYRPSEDVRVVIATTVLKLMSAPHGNPRWDYI